MAKDDVSGVYLTDSRDGYSHKPSKQLKLFGFELRGEGEGYKELSVSAEGNESVNSSSVTSEKGMKEVDEKKYECQFCRKRFENSQGLGGHQNAHRKERMKKKRLQLQARRDTVASYYLQPLLNGCNIQFLDNYQDSSDPWNHSSTNRFSIYDESNINFGSLDQNYDHKDGWLNSPELEQSKGFSMAFCDNFSLKKQCLLKQSFGEVDLQLGLAFTKQRL